MPAESSISISQRRSSAATLRASSRSGVTRAAVAPGSRAGGGEECDRDRFLLRAGAVVPAQPVENVGGLSRKTPPSHPSRRRAAALPRRAVPDARASSRAYPRSRRGRAKQRAEDRRGPRRRGCRRGPALMAANQGFPPVSTPTSAAGQPADAAGALRRLRSPTTRCRRGRGRGQEESPRPDRDRAISDKKIRDPRDAADQSRGDYRMARRQAPPGGALPFQQHVSPRSCIDGAFLGEYPRPVLRQDLEQVMDNAPMLRQSVREHVGDPVEARPLARHPIERSRARAAASAAACPGRSGAPPRLSPQRSTRRVSSSRRRSSEIAGGSCRSSSLLSKNDSSSASRSPIARIRGSSSAIPASLPFGSTRRNASRNDRTARRVGSNTVMRDTANGSPPAMPSSPAANVVRNGRKAAIV